MPWNRAWGRDPRLDFFRGLAMMIIFIAHVPHNWLASYIPGRFGPSDAAEMFVFCSGFAAAIAFGGTFTRFGIWTGVRRVLYRCWQIYWAQLCLIIVSAGVFVSAAWLFDNPDYIIKSSIRPLLLDRTPEALVGLFTLTYIPYVFDILPMYIVALLMMPAVILLHRIHPLAALAFCLSLYLSTWLLDLELPAEPWSDRAWYFNPFAWQLLFYTGFAISAGWVRGPGPNPWLVGLALAVVIGFIPLTFWGFRADYPELGTLYHRIIFWGDHNPAFSTGRFKSDMHLARTVHFLSLAYLATYLLRGRERLLLSRWLAPIVKVGQQALATFMTSIILSRFGGIFLNEVGRTAWSWVAVNVVGILVLIAVAYIVGWYKAAPWTRPRNDPRSAALPAATAGTATTAGAVMARPAYAGD